MTLSAVFLTGCSMNTVVSEVNKAIQGEGRHAETPSYLGTAVAEISRLSSDILSVEIKEEKSALLFLPGNPQTVTIKVSTNDVDRVSDVVMKVQNSLLNWLDDDAVIRFEKDGQVLYEYTNGLHLSQESIKEEIASVEGVGS